MDRQILETPEIKNIKKVPFRCVVCNGFGTVASGKKICQGCGGKGYVVIDQTDGQTDYELETTNTN